MKKNNKAIKKKASIFRMYGKYFLLFIVFVGILGALNDMIKNPAHRLFYKSIIYGFSYICFGIVVLMVVTYVLFTKNQPKQRYTIQSYLYFLSLSIRWRYR